MYSKKYFSALIVVLCSALLGLAESAYSQPLEQTVSFSIYEDPDDPSELIWMVVLYLTESDSNGNSIGWAVDQITLFEVNASPTPDREWIETSPKVDTTDGLFWVVHADPDDPQLSEFVLPPFISGLAVAQDTDEPDLEYETEGFTYVEPTEGPHFTITAALDIKFAEEAASLPLINRDAEPVEVFTHENPPIGW